MASTDIMNAWVRDVQAKVTKQERFSQGGPQIPLPTMIDRTSRGMEAVPLPVMTVAGCTNAFTVAWVVWFGISFTITTLPKLDL